MRPRPCLSMGTRSRGPTVVSLMAARREQSRLTSMKKRVRRIKRYFTFGSLIGIELATVLLSRLDLAEFLRCAEDTSATREK